MPVSLFAEAGIIFNQSSGIITGNVGLATSVPLYKIDVSSGIINTQGTGSGFKGDGSAITGVTIMASSEGVTGQSIASVTDIVTSTVTITNRGGRIQYCEAHATLNNAAGGSRDYTYSIYKNNVQVSEGDYVQTASGTSTEFVEYPRREDSSTAGAQQFSFHIKSSSASGTQTVRHPDIICFEF